MDTADQITGTPPTVESVRHIQCAFIQEAEALVTLCRRAQINASMTTSYGHKGLRWNVWVPEDCYHQVRAFWRGVRALQALLEMGQI